MIYSEIFPNVSVECSIVHLEVPGECLDQLLGVLVYHWVQVDVRGVPQSCQLVEKVTFISGTTLEKGTGGEMPSVVTNSELQICKILSVGSVVM